MLARVITVNVKPDKLDEAIALYRESIIPAMVNQNGYLGAYLLGQPDTGKSITISFWRTAEDAKANEESGYLEEQVRKCADCFCGEPTVEGYEVPVSDRP